MYRNKYQPKILSLLLSAGSKPLEIWKTKTKKGCIRKVLDEAIKLSAIEILSENTSDSYIYTAPHNFTSLAINLPIIVLIVKNMNRYFSFRISVLDDRNCRRTFRISNFQTVTRLSTKWCTMPMVLNDGWNIIQINLKDYTEKAFRTKYVETIDIQINASIRIRCIYFCDRIYKNEELKDEFKIFSKKKEKIKYNPPQNLKKLEKKTTIKNIKKDKNTKKEDDLSNKGISNKEEKEKGKEKVDDNLNIKESEEKNENNEEIKNKEKIENNEKIENIEDIEQIEYTEIIENIEINEKKDIDNDIDNKTDGEENYLADIIDNINGDDIEGNKENENRKLLVEDAYNEENDVPISNITEIKNLEIDLNNVLYDDINYENYNNDDN